MWSSGNKTVQTTTPNGDDDYDFYGHDDEDSKDTPHETDSVKAEAGTIAGTVFGVLVAAVFLAFVVGMYFKQRRQRKERDTESKVLHTSRMHAGVYMPTTSETELQQMPGYTAARGSDASHSSRGQEYKSLPKHPDLFESDSDEELWSKNAR
ncbi:hypothetical protein DPMN_108499 [Dreissena polymorpha]|uniref:Uncharacterized protein n=2 Tax=Dreissena polymorpha TaxID=45954 RepID=A0A9D4QL19_DREPO|nr:hypothetical protein DPMN_108499 [Dreissena polymorpha]